MVKLDDADLSARLAQVRRLLGEIAKHPAKRPEDPATVGKILLQLGCIEERHGFRREPRIPRCLPVYPASCEGRGFVED